MSTQLQDAVAADPKIAFGLWETEAVNAQCPEKSPINPFSC